MIIFIDESGDPGFRLTKGSSKYFVISLVIFDDELDAEETALKIKRLRQKLKKSDRFEFKFNSSNPVLKEQFLHEIKNCKFRVRSIIINKADIYSHGLKTRKDKFYNFVLKQILEKNNNTIKQAKIRIDGSGERSFRKGLEVYLRQNLKGILKDLKFRDSQEDVLIQLADMVAGATRKAYEGSSTNDKKYLSIIKTRVQDNWEFR